MMMLFVVSFFMQLLSEGVTIADVDINSARVVISHQEILTKFWSNPAGFDVGRGAPVEGVVFKHIRKAGGTTIDKRIKRALEVPPESGYGWQVDDPLTLSYGWQKRGNMMLKWGNASMMSDHDGRGVRIPRYYMQEYGAMDGRCAINRDRRRRWLLVLALRHPLSRHWSEFWYAGPGRGPILTRMAQLRTGVTVNIINDFSPTPLSSQSQRPDQQPRHATSTVPSKCNGYYKKGTTTSDGAPQFFQFDTLDNRRAKTLVQASDKCRMYRQDGTWWLVPPSPTPPDATNEERMMHASYCSHEHAASDNVPLQGWATCDSAQELQLTRLDTKTLTTTTINTSFSIIRTMPEFEETVRKVFRSWVQDSKNTDGGTRSHSAMRRGRYYSDFQIRSMLGDCEGTAQANVGPHPEFRKDFLCAQGPATVDGGCLWNTLHRINTTDYERVKLLVSQFDIVLTTERMHDPAAFAALDFALRRFNVEGVAELDVDTTNKAKRSTPKLNANKKSSGVEIKQTLGSELMAELSLDNAWDIKLHDYVTATRRDDGLRDDDDGDKHDLSP
eukprot:m.167463 g.167463  ORF g.167463 m.167463 type:complete len:557 (+) comp31462_c0_seq6:456-2126(+)